jgi:hypothetical protein
MTCFKDFCCCNCRLCNPCQCNQCCNQCCDQCFCNPCRCQFRRPCSLQPFPPQPRPPIRERGLLSEFQTDEPLTRSGAISGQAGIPLTTTPTVIAELSNAKGTALHMDDPAERVWLTGSVGWQAEIPPTMFAGFSAKVIFRIWRNVVSGSPIFEIVATSELTPSLNNFQVTAFPFIDLNPITIPGQQVVQYFLTAELFDAQSNASIIGPITFIGAKIEPNRLFEP